MEFKTGNMDTNPYYNYLQYNNYPDYGYGRLESQFTNPVVQTNAMNHINQIYPGMDQSLSTGYVTPKSDFKPSSNYLVAQDIQAQNTQNRIEKQQAVVAGDKQLGKGVNQGVDTIASAVPVYGQYYAAAKGLESVGKGFLPKDDQGNVKGKFAQGLEAEFTPVHEQVINDLTEKKYGDAALDLVTGGQYKVVKKWFS